MKSIVPQNGSSHNSDVGDMVDAMLRGIVSIQTAQVLRDASPVVTPSPRPGAFEQAALATAAFDHATLTLQDELYRLGDQYHHDVLRPIAERVITAYFDSLQGRVR